MEVFDAWDRGELIGEDGKSPGLILKAPRSHITKTDLTPTLGLRDSDLVALAKEIIGNRVAIKQGACMKDRLTLADWCRDVKLDRVIMNELMWKLRSYRLPCKDGDWVPYTDAAWEELAAEKNFTPAVVRNIWQTMRKYTDGDQWLKGRGNVLSPTTDKSKVDHAIAPPVFHTTVEEFTTVKLNHGIFSGSKLLYDCMHADTLADVRACLEGDSEVLDLREEIAKLLVVFAYSQAGDPIAISKSDVNTVAGLAKFKAPSQDDDLDEDFEPDEDDDDSRDQAPSIPVPMFWIGSARTRDVVSQVSLQRDTTWAAHTVYYLPSPREGFKKSELDSLPLVTLSLTYPKPNDDDLWKGFKKHTGLAKPLEPVLKSVEGDIDWNDGACGVCHSVIEKLLKPAVRKSSVLVVNVWGGGNVTEIAMVSTPHPALSIVSAGSR